MIDNWNGGNMVATLEVEPNKTSSYGIISPGKVIENKIEVKNIVEKPDPQNAPSNIAVVGRYIVEPSVFDHLALQKKGINEEIQLTDSLSYQIGKTPFFGYNFQGKRYDCGTKLGFAKANTSLAIKDPDIGNQFKNWITKLNNN